MEAHEDKMYPGDGWQIYSHEHAVQAEETLYLELFVGGRRQSRQELFSVNKSDVEAVAKQRMYAIMLQAVCDAVNVGIHPEALADSLQAFFRLVSPIELRDATLQYVVPAESRYQAVYRRTNGDFLIVVPEQYAELLSPEEMAVRLPNVWLPRKEDQENEGAIAEYCAHSEAQGED